MAQVGTQVPQQGNVRRCPACNAACPVQATICYSCKKPMAEIIQFRRLTEDEVARIEAELQPLVEQADAPLERRGQPFRLRRRTWLIPLCLFGVFAIVGAAANNDVTVIAGLGSFAAVVLVLVWIVSLVNDLIAPGARGRRSSERAVRCYFRQIQNRNWRAAFACLSPMAREREASVPDIPALRSSPLVVVRATPDRLAAYWRTLCCRTGLNQYRRLRKIEIEPIATSGAVHRHRVGLTINHGVFGLDPYRKHFEVVTYRFRSQWWIYGGEFQSPAPSGV